MSKKNEEATPGDAFEKKTSKKWLVVVLAVLLSVSALVGGLVIAMGTDKVLGLFVGADEEDMDEHSKMDSESTNDEAEMEEEHGEDNAKLVVLPMDEMIVNIVSITVTGRKSTRFLKMNLAVVFDENIEGAKYITERKVYIRDAFQNYLRQLTERDLSGSIGFARLKSELLRRARAVTESDAPREILIADIIVQ